MVAWWRRRGFGRCWRAKTLSELRIRKTRDIYHGRHGKARKMEEISVRHGGISAGATTTESAEGTPIYPVNCVFCGRPGALLAPNVGAEGWVFVDCGSSWEGPGWQCPQCLVGYVE